MDLFINMGVRYYMNIMIKVIYNDRSEIHFHDGDTNERIFKQNIYYRVSECAE